MQIISIDMQCLNSFQQTDSNGQIIKSLIQIDIATKAQKDVF